MHPSTVTKFEELDDKLFLDGYHLYWLYHPVGKLTAAMFYVYGQFFSPDINKKAWPFLSHAHAQLHSTYE